MARFGLAYHLLNSPLTELAHQRVLLNIKQRVLVPRMYGLPQRLTAYRTHCNGA